MSVKQGAKRLPLPIQYPRLILLQFAVHFPAQGAASNGGAIWRYPTIMKALAGAIGVAVAADNVFGTADNVGTTFVQLQGGRDQPQNVSFDISTERVSIAGAVITGSATFDVTRLRISGNDQGVGAVKGTSTILFANNMTVLQLLGSNNSIQIGILEQPQAPDVMPLRGDVEITGGSAALSGSETITVSLALWVTPREDLV